MDLVEIKNLGQTFASEESGAVRVDFDCTLVLLVEAIQQKLTKRQSKLAWHL